MPSFVQRWIDAICGVYSGVSWAATPARVSWGAGEPYESSTHPVSGRPPDGEWRGVDAQEFEVASIKANPQGYIDLGGGARLLSGRIRWQTVAHLTSRATQFLRRAHAAVSRATSVMKQGLCWTATGLLLGIAGGIAATFALSRVLRGVAVVDPFALIITPLLLATTAALACLIPGRRAGRVDPLTALREQ